MKMRILLLIAVVSLIAAVNPEQRGAYNPSVADITFNFTVQPININGNGADFAPAFYENGIVFCSSKRDNLRFGTMSVGNDLTLYYATKNADNTFKSPQKMKGKGMNGFEAGPAFITPNHKQIIFTRNKDKSVKDEDATWGLYFADMTADTEWGEADHFVHNFNQFDVQQPSLSPDGNILYFVSDIAGGVGGTDIYMCYKIGNSWSRPENLGSKINSIYNESFPFMSSDGTLYYSSAGFDNTDGVDIFYTRKIAGEWLAPVKLPAPVNSAKDDFSFIISLDQTGAGYGYFASDRNGNTDLFSFSVTISKQEPFAGLQSGGNDIAMARSVSGDGGQMIGSSQPIGKKVMLNGIIGMNKIYFPQGRSHIIPEAARELDKLVAYMVQNPRLNVEISVHTDARGDDDANLQLSTKRANSVQAYLMSNNVDGSRITSLGYGETQLLNYCRNGMNCSDDMHDQNNRVEVRATPESEFAVNWGTLNYNGGAVTQSASLNEPVSRSIDLLSAADNGKLFYKLTIGPFERIDNRTFYECRQLDNNLSYEDSPKGKLVVLGPYENMQEAYRNKAYLESRGIQRTQVNSISSSAMQRYELPKDELFEETDNEATYEIHVGPFKHVDNNTYHRFANLGTPLHIEYTNKGMMIVLGPYKNMSDVDQYRELVKQRVSSNKTKVQVFNDDEPVLVSKKMKRKLKREGKL